MSKIKIEVKRKRVRVVSPGWQAMGHGFYDNVEERVYYDKVYKSKKQAKKLLKKAQKTYSKVKGRTLEKEPEVQYYWETLKVKKSKRKK